MANPALRNKSSLSATAPLSRVEVTSDTLTGRGGLALFSRYIRHIEIAEPIERLFGGLRRSRKGLGVAELFHQLFCFLVDGTSRHLVYFDALKKDAGYAGAIETLPERMASSHQVKRLFAAFGWGRIWLFRRLLRQLFLWELNKRQPTVIRLGLDTMVMDNDEAEARQGCQPTYKKVKGFQPLQLTWGPFIADALFRGGKKNGNAGKTAFRIVRDTVHFIRRHYRVDVPIVITLDSGFFDQKLLRDFDKLGVGYIVGGKLYEDLTALAGGTDRSLWSVYDNGHPLWEYLEFADRRPSWDWKEIGWQRTFYTRPLYENEQRLLEFARPDQILYTNLGQGGPVDAHLCAAGHAEWTSPQRIIEIYHTRGSDELVHRALKDFRAEQLPFRRFQSNAAFYYTVLVAFFLFEAFKRDVSDSVVPATAYATRIRRQVIDFAAKIVRTSGWTLLKVTAAAWQRLRVQELWARSGDPPRFAWVP